MDVAKEKRRFDRFTASWPVEARFESGAGRAEAVNGVITNLSVAGAKLKLKLSDRPAIGSVVDLALVRPDTGEPVNIQGRVCWLGTSPEPRWDLEVGVELMEMDKSQWEGWFQLVVFGDNPSLPVPNSTQA